MFKGKNIKTERSLLQEKNIHLLRFSKDGLILRLSKTPFRFSLTREGCMEKARKTLLEIISSSLTVGQKRKAKVIKAKKDYKAMRML